MVRVYAQEAVEVAVRVRQRVGLCLDGMIDCSQPASTKRSQFSVGLIRRSSATTRAPKERAEGGIASVSRSISHKAFAPVLLAYLPYPRTLEAF